MTNHAAQTDSFSAKSLTDSDTINPKLARLIDHFVEELNAGRMVNVDELLAFHPELREDAQAAFESILALHGSITTDTTHEPLIAELGDYRLLGEIGRGGMGIVYEAEEKSLERRVALKILPLASLMEERRLQRFRNESRAAASLRHPNIVSIHSVGQEKGIHYYVMDLIEGADLSKVIASVHGEDRERGFVPADSTTSSPQTTPIANLSTQRSSGNKADFYRSVAKMGIQAAEALHFAHERGVIHRDIKPGNLLLDESGAIHITDFGLARMRGQQELTVSSDLVGTLRYMSPEQLDDESKVDHQTDIYSLGLTLYELISGQPAFEAASKPALMKQILDSDPKSIRRLCPSIPNDLATIIETAIAKDSADRYSSAADLATDLQAFLDIKSIKAKRSTLFDHFRRFSKRKPKLIAAFLGVLSLVAATSIFAAWNYSAAAKQEAERNRLQRMRRYAAEMQIGQLLAKAGNRFELQDLLLRWVPNEKNPRDLRGFEWFHLWQRLDNPALIHTFDHELPLSAVKFVTGSNLVTGGFTEELTEWSLQEGKNTEPIREITPNQTGSNKQFLLDEAKNWLVVADDQFGCFAVDLATNKQIKSLDLNNKGMPTPVVSPDGTRIVFSGGTYVHGFVRVTDSELNEVLHSIDLPSRAYAQFDSEGNLIVAQEQSHVIQVYNADYDVIRSKSLQEFGACAIDASPNRELLAIAVHTGYGSTDSRVEIWNSRSLSREKTINVESRCERLRFSHDGKLLAIGDTAGNLQLVELNHESLKETRVLCKSKAHTGIIYGLDFANDGTRLATAASDGLMMVWDIERLVEPDSGIVTMENRQTVSFANHLYRKDSAISAHRYVGCLEWGLNDGKVTQVVEVDSARGNSHVRVAVAREANLACVFVGVWRNDVKSKVAVIDLGSGEQIGEIPIPPAGVSVTGCDMTRDGRYLALCTHDSGLMIFDVPLRSIYVNRKDIDAKTIRFSVDDELLVAGDTKGFVHVLSADEKFRTIETVKLDERLVDCIDISNDKQFIGAVGSDKHVKLYNRTTGDIRVFRDELPAFPNLIRFSPDGDRVLTCSLDGILRLWMTEIGEQIHSWELRPKVWASGEFSDDGETIMVGGIGVARAFHARSIDETRRLSESVLRTSACQNISSK